MPRTPTFPGLHLLPAAALGGVCSLRDRARYHADGSLDVSTLRAFVLVAETGRVSGVARTLGVQQSTISRQLQRLEDYYGVKLAQRTKSGVLLTQQGEVVLAGARATLTALDEARAQVEQHAHSAVGELRVGLMTSVCDALLLSAVAALIERYPGLSLRAVEAPTDQLERLLSEGELDLAVLATPLGDGDLTVRRLWDDDYVLVVSKAHGLAQSTGPVSWATFATEPLAMASPKRAVMTAIERACASLQRAPNWVLRAGSGESVRRLVEEGTAVTVVPGSVIATASAPWRVVTRPIDASAAKRTVALAYRGATYLSAAGRAFRDEVLRVAAEHPRKRDVSREQRRHHRT